MRIVSPLALLLSHLRRRDDSENDDGEESTGRVAKGVTWREELVTVDMPPPTSLCTVLRRAQRQKRGPVESKRAFHPKNKIDLQSHVGFSLQWRSTMGESSTMDRRCDCPWLSEGGRCEGLYRLPNPCRLGRMGRKGPPSLLSRTTGAASVFARSGIAPIQLRGQGGRRRKRRPAPGYLFGRASQRRRKVPPFPTGALRDAAHSAASLSPSQSFHRRKKDESKTFAATLRNTFCRALSRRAIRRAFLVHHFSMP